mgnify:CR=1 FL=1
MRLLILSILILTTSIQAYSQKFTTKKGGHSYTLDVPNYMTKTYDLNDAATLEYKNSLKEAYLIVIPDSKDELKASGSTFIDTKDFLSYFIKDYQIEAERRTITDIATFKSNKNPHSQVEMNFGIDNNDFFMLITIVETKTHFYKILSWTLLEYKDKFREDYLKISKSLKD